MVLPSVSPSKKNYEEGFMSFDIKPILSQLAAPKAFCQDQIKTLRELQIKPELGFNNFLSAYRESVLAAWDFGALLDADPTFANTPLSRLEEINRDYYQRLDPDNGYATCLANPDYAHELYGAELGSLISALYMRSFSVKALYLQQNFVAIKANLELFWDLLELAQKNDMTYQSWLQAYITRSQQDFQQLVQASYVLRFSPEADYNRRIICDADLSDIRYLYRYGVHLSKHDLAMADFISHYDAKELKKIASYIVQCWVDGFERARRDYRIKRYATVIIPVGMEALGRLVIQDLEQLGLQCIVPAPQNQGINRQLGYDHRFDSALSFTREYVEMSLKVSEESIEDMKDIFGLQAGPVYVMLFGETPFNPVPKKTCLKLSDEQQGLFREHSARNTQIYLKYAKRDESSFSIIAFPSTEIGERFPEIFADTLKINLLESNHYAKIQQHIIDVLDTADYVHVKGKAGNDTDIRVQMHKLTDPTTQTLFENCVADVNIPVGEVFTSPVLKGSTGTLHVEDIYLDSLRYFNLKVHFEDGWVRDYSCSNFEDPEEGKRYIHENLLLPHKSLPIGEFAIGTNTTAYLIAKKYDIMHLLPILIIEKMGPHFAIGDTCYSHEEDAPHPSILNGKEMIAVENEKSCTRKTDPLNAYTQKHMDITLPYEMLSSITAVSKDGKGTDIIRDGFFVVAGTEELNIPLLEMANLSE